MRWQPSNECWNVTDWASYQRIIVENRILNNFRLVEIEQMSWARSFCRRGRQQSQDGRS